jgi:Circularly permutated YpsA SLOG family
MIRAVFSIRGLRKPLLIKIISGGQTGVDRAALDAAMACGMVVGGWCPRDRTAEDGSIPAIYPLTETPGRSYPIRTMWNVRDSNGTLLFRRGEASRGTALTMARAKELKKPLYVVDLALPLVPAAIADWIAQQSIRVLNVAGPRESESPGIYEAAKKAIGEVLACPGVLS